MTSETRVCQNCKTQFTIEPEDFTFYEKIKVPPPTWCPECRMVRRMTWRNERALYKRNCALCGKGVVSMYAPDKPFTVYCIECYQSDKWDPFAYGRDYDFSKPFFEQFRELMSVVPRRALYIDFAANSDYTNWAVYLKNAYLVFGGHHYEDTYYTSQSLYLKDCYDVDFCKKSELCVASLHLKQCSRVFFGLFSEDCTDSWFIFNCRNCQHCVGCANLRNKNYCILNEQYSKEDWEKKVRELGLDSRESLVAFRDRFLADTLRYPRKYAWTRNVVNSTGDDLEQVKNCRYVFSASEDEDCRYSFFVPTGAKWSYDLDHVGLGTEFTLELMSGFGNSRVRFGNRVYYSHDVDYSDDCYNSANLFGCIGIKKKEYCVLNKQYDPSTFEKLKTQIIDHMQADVYKDEQGRAYRFGEFFPSSLSPYAYNETVAQEYWPLSKETTEEKGFSWRDPETKHYQITMKADALPDRVDDTSETIVNETIGCSHEGKCNEQCTTAFRILKQELETYKRAGIPLPRLCPNCRHYQRLKQRNPLKLWHRQCTCGGAGSENGAYKNTASHFHGRDHCPNDFETTYAPERSEIVYCEQCYNAEVV